MILPTTPQELKELGWERPDIILVSGDTYIDSPFIGTAMIGTLLAQNGFRVGILAQPDPEGGQDISRLGEPLLFWGITAGSVDSMVSNYTSLGKKRHSDDFTPGGINNRRPDRATIVYANLIRRYFKDTKPIVLGGIEASLRRIAHYDFWDNTIRRSLLFDAKADVLLYGMAEKAILEFARRLRKGEDYREIRGLCYIAGGPKEGYVQLPSYEEVKKDQEKFTEMYHCFFRNTIPSLARGLTQQQDSRFLVHNPPSASLSEKELDSLYEMPFTRDVHPFYRSQGRVKALETIRHSVTTHRGCFGECNFCSISIHQGRSVRSRSEDSILKEVQTIAALPGFKGYITDVGGPTANMYGMHCSHAGRDGGCLEKRCLFPVPCKNLQADHERQIRLLQRLRQIPGIKRIFIASGVRHDLVMEDKAFGMKYLEELLSHHTSGQLKIAPEHTEEKILRLMGKPVQPHLMPFKSVFDKLNRKLGKKQFLTYYFIAAHPGCDQQDMQKLHLFVSSRLKTHPEQVQIFTPTPSTYSTLMFYTGRDPFTGEILFVEKDPKRKESQKNQAIAKGKKP